MGTPPCVGTPGMAHSAWLAMLVTLLAGRPHRLGRYFLKSGVEHRRHGQLFG